MKFIDVVSHLRKFIPKDLFEINNEQIRYIMVEYKTHVFIHKYVNFKLFKKYEPIEESAKEENVYVYTDDYYLFLEQYKKDMLFFTLKNSKESYIL